MSRPGLRRPGPVATVAAALVTVVVLVALVAGAVHGGTVAGRYDNGASRAAARVDSAYYDCVDRQVRSLVAPGVPVTFPDNGGNFVTLLKAVGNWVTIAARPQDAALRLTLENRPGPGACLGTVVVARSGGEGPGAVRIGTGASLPGHGPPPAPPL